MSRESDKLMLKLPMADVSKWLWGELTDLIAANYPANQYEQMVSVAKENMLLHLIAKLGQDENPLASGSGDAAEEANALV